MYYVNLHARLDVGYRHSLVRMYVYVGYICTHVCMYVVACRRTKLLFINLSPSLPSYAKHISRLIFVFCRGVLLVTFPLLILLLICMYACVHASAYEGMRVRVCFVRGYECMDECTYGYTCVLYLRLALRSASFVG